MPGRVSPLKVLAVLRRGQLRSPSRVGYILPIALYLLLLWRSTWKTNHEMGGDYWRQLRKRSSTVGLVVTAHIVLWRYLFTKALLATKVGALFFQKTVAVPFHAVNFVGEKTSYYSLAFQDTIQDRFDRWLDAKMNILGEKLKELLKDPYMPEPLRHTIDDAVDFVLPDLKLALFIKTDEYITFRAPAAERFLRRKSEEGNLVRVTERKEVSPMRRFQPNRDLNVLDLDKILQAIEEAETEQAAPSMAGLSREEIVCRLKRIRFHFWGIKEFLSLGIHIRAWILYNLSPYDKSFWQCLHNPLYLILISIGLFPSFGVIWWFFLFMLHDKRDEFQICQFIVGFQTAKFFSQGWFSLIKGALLYYLCAVKDEPSCDTDGPMLNGTLDASLFIFQIILVWLTFFILPYTQPCSDVEDARDAYLIAFEKRNDLNRAALQAKVRLGRGGRLMNLFWWETITVILVLCAATAAYVLGQENWKLYATWYWLRTAYGLLCLPFVPFKLPIMGGLLTPTKATGYNRVGKTVIRVISEDFPSEKEPAHAQTNAPQSLPKVARMDSEFSFENMRKQSGLRSSSRSTSRSGSEEFEAETLGLDKHQSGASEYEFEMKSESGEHSFSPESRSTEEDSDSPSPSYNTVEVEMKSKEEKEQFIDQFEEKEHKEDGHYRPGLRRRFRERSGKFLESKEE